MPNKHTILLGKAVRYMARLRGGGSALPGLFVEKIDPTFVSKTLSQLPNGVVIISGTNGKTTTTKMVVELLESTGLKVFTNRTGSNFSRGVAAALLGEINIKGNLTADIAVLELDEAHAVNFVESVPPRYTLLLNVMRDQLDRFGEIDKTATMLRKIAEATTDTVILNREDARVAKIGELLPKSIHVDYFGLSGSLRATFPSDDDLYAPSASGKPNTKASVTLDSFSDDTATFTIGTKNLSSSLKLRGIYNIFNAAAALALVRTITGEDNDEELLKALSDVTPAFGRGEKIIIDGQPLELILVKNPSGFRLGLQSFSPDKYATMIAINDNYADGRDMSWLWDVSFDSLQKDGVSIVSGIRAYDMALRLQYDEIPVSHVTPKLSHALRQFISITSGKPKRIYCTYTAMTSLRRELAKITKVEIIS